MDAEVDIGLLESLKAEMIDRLRGEAPVIEKPLLELMEDTFSNSVQMAKMRTTLAESVPAEMSSLKCM